MEKDKIANDLMSQGFEAVESFQIKEAIKIGNKLKKLRHSSAFEILALSHHADDNTKKAIKVLKEGVQLAPDVWRLWQLLGNYQSELGQFEEAQISYQKAQECPNADNNSIYYNSSLAYIKEDNLIEADKQWSMIDLDEIKETDNPELLISVFALKIDILNNLGKFQNASLFFDFVLSQNINLEDYNEKTSYLFTSYATTLWKLGRSEQALKLLWEAIALNKKDGKASWLIREIEKKYTKASKYYRIMIEGIWPEQIEGESQEMGFYTSYDVVADTLDEAFAYIKRFEPENVRDALKIEEHKVLKKSPNLPQGVYDANAYLFFPKQE